LEIQSRQNFVDVLPSVAGVRVTLRVPGRSKPREGRGR
jgi:hypothetical protein